MDIPEISYSYSLKFQCTKVQYQYNSKNKHYTTQYFRFEELQQQQKTNKPKMAYSRDLPKMARQQCGIMD